MSSTTIILRTVVVIIGAGLLVWAYDLHTAGVRAGCDWVLIFDGAVIVIGVFFERGRYRPTVDTTKGNWTRTGEKFKDPTTGKNLEVVFNPETGERDYVEI